jgi:hypothetical protein
MKDIYRTFWTFIGHLTDIIFKPAVHLNSTIVPASQALAVVPSCALVTVHVVPFTAVTSMISLFEASNNVTRNGGSGKPVDELTVILVAEFVILLSSVVFAKLAAFKRTTYITSLIMFYH